MTEIKLDPKYVPLVENKEKTSTIRAGVRDYPAGPAVLVCGGRRILIVIIRLVVKRFSELTEFDARVDGFESISALREALKSFYPNLEDKDLVTIVYFSLDEQKMLFEAMAEVCQAAAEHVGKGFHALPRLVNALSALERLKSILGDDVIRSFEEHRHRFFPNAESKDPLREVSESDPYAAGRELARRSLEEYAEKHLGVRPEERAV